MLGILALFIVVAVVHPAPPILPSGSAAPAVRLHAVDGSVVSVVKPHDGRAVLLIFFQATCSTCGTAMQGVCHVAATNGRASVAAIDAGNDDAHAAAAFSGRYLPPGCPIAVLLDPGLGVSRGYGVAVVPTAYVIDSNGVIRFGAYGASGVDTAVSALTRLTGG